jgi:DNA-binding CsgD family transcriptional regulator
MAPTGMDTLSDRERTVLRLVQQGFQTDEIARALERSPNTIENQIASARRKLGGVTRRKAARLLHDAEHGGLSTNQPFAIPDLVGSGDASGAVVERVQEERAIFLPIPAALHETSPPGAPPHSSLHTIAMIVATAVGIMIILAATPSLIASFRALTAWILTTFY